MKMNNCKRVILYSKGWGSAETTIMTSQFDFDYVICFDLIYVKTN